jgi:hypothetical protein
MIERCAVGHLTHPPCNMCRVCSLLLKISWKSSSERSFGKPYISCIGYTDARSTTPLTCAVGTEPLAQRSFAFKDSVNWVEQKFEDTRRVCDERYPNSDETSIHECPGGRGILARSSQDAIRVREPATDSVPKSWPPTFVLRIRPDFLDSAA